MNVYHDDNHELVQLFDGLYSHDNPKLQFTQNWCIYTNRNICWFLNSTTKHQY
jgi:hypothetical protein